VDRLKDASKFQLHHKKTKSIEAHGVLYGNYDNRQSNIVDNAPTGLLDSTDKNIFNDGRPFTSAATHRKILSSPLVQAL
jgi:hypothetical protein